MHGQRSWLSWRRKRTGSFIVSPWTLLVPGRANWINVVINVEYMFMLFSCFQSNWNINVCLVVSPWPDGTWRTSETAQSCSTSLLSRKLLCRQDTKPTKVQLDNDLNWSNFSRLLFSMHIHILQASSSLRTPPLGTSSSLSFHVWNLTPDLWPPGLPSCLTSAVRQEPCVCLCMFF